MTGSRGGGQAVNGHRRPTGTGLSRGRVLVDARPLQGASSLRGMGSYVRGLLGGLVSAGFDDRLALLLDGGMPLPQLPDGDYVVFTVRRRYRGRFAPYEDATALPGELEGLSPDLYHATTLSLPGRIPCPMIVTLHDLIPWALGGRHMIGERLRYRIGRSVLRRARTIVAPSEATAGDAIRIAGVDPQRIKVIAEGVDSRFRRMDNVSGERWGLTKPFLLYIGALDHRKDPAALLRAWEVARAEGADCDLVLAGAAGKQAPKSMDGARRLGYLPTDELARLLSAAACLIFPSRYEGFGLPLIEAMACGCPVVAYDNSSLPEAAGDVGTLVPDGDAEALGRAAATYLLDAERQLEAREAGLRRARTFSWAKAARATLDAYQEAGA